jgi:hypothetical protein
MKRKQPSIVVSSAGRPWIAKIEGHLEEPYELVLTVDAWGFVGGASKDQLLGYLDFRKGTDAYRSEVVLAAMDVKPLTKKQISKACGAILGYLVEDWQLSEPLNALLLSGDVRQAPVRIKDYQVQYGYTLASD